jgi:hypothetical protein
MVGDNFMAYGMIIVDQTNLLNIMDKFILSMRVHGKKGIVQFQKGVLMTNLSLRRLFNDLQQNYKRQYIIITRRLNQDVLEIFLVLCEGSNDHPNL